METSLEGEKKLVLSMIDSLNQQSPAYMLFAHVRQPQCDLKPVDFICGQFVCNYTYFI